MTSNTASKGLGPFQSNRIYRMDALVGMKALPNESVDLIVTDPPFNITTTAKSTIKNGKIVSLHDVMGDWDVFHPFDYDVFISAVISESYRILKPGGALYMFTAREHNGFFIRKAVERGFLYRNQIAVVKLNPLPSFAKSNWRSSFEACLYVTKGKPKLFNFLSQKECVNVISHPLRRKTKHPTEKPVDVIKRFIAVSSNQGDLVLDPFMGSGTTAVAASELGRKFLGFEKKKEYIAMARERLKKAGHSSSSSSSSAMSESSSVSAPSGSSSSSSSR